jgi:hypothetical protein
MTIVGPGGTGKSTLINAITKTFQFHNAASLFAKTATSGVAASLIGGSTLHSWAGIPVRIGNNQIRSSSKATKERRKLNIGSTSYVCVDECSMLNKKLLNNFSKIAQQTRSELGIGSVTEPFGGLCVILTGDFHQFPFIIGINHSLFHSQCIGAEEELGMAIY